MLKDKDSYPQMEKTTKSAKLSTIIKSLFQQFKSLKQAFYFIR